MADLSTRLRRAQRLVSRTLPSALLVLLASAHVMSAEERLCWVGPLDAVDPQGVTLRPVLRAGFGGDTLDPAWERTLLDRSGSVRLVDGALAVEAATVRRPIDTPGRAGDGTAAARTLEFEARFGESPDQEVGLFEREGPVLAAIGTGAAGSLRARIHDGTAERIVPLDRDFLGAVHRYRIEVAPGSVDFRIDGVCVAGSCAGDGAQVLGAKLDPTIRDGAADGSALRVDWMRMPPHAMRGRFVSPVVDLGAPQDWGRVELDVERPEGTALDLTVRVGDTARPDRGWSSIERIRSGDVLGLTGRYAQYEAALRTDDPDRTPALRRVALSCAPAAEGSLALRGTSALDLPDCVSAPTGGSVTIPLHVTGAVGFEGVNLQLAYDPTVLAPTDVTAGALTTGSSCTVFSNLGVPGQIGVALFCLQPASGSGTLVNLEFDVIGATSSTSALGFVSADVNEGAVATSTDDGLFTESPGTDTDQDGQVDFCDADDDGDGVADGPDDDPLDAHVCADADGDSCDDCSQTGANGSGGDVADDGADFDGDGACDAGDADDDGDGVDDVDDTANIDPFVCRDLDGDNCDDCSQTGADGSGGDIADDGLDTDADGACDAGDLDDDNDGVDDGSDLASTNECVCRDVDGDSCDDCSQTGADESGGDPTNDGLDTDLDGACNLTDPDDDNDGVDDGPDLAPLDPALCCSVEGTVLYYRDFGGVAEPSAKPVSGVEIDYAAAAVGDGSGDQTTGAAGAFSFTPVGGTASVTALGRYEAGGPDPAMLAITSTDAGFIAQHSIASISLSANQQIAADATGNGTVSAFDAAQVAQLAAGLDVHLPVADAEGSDWRFLRCDSYPDEDSPVCAAPTFVYDPLAGSTNDLFYAILYGDVTGNWDEAARAASPEPELDAAAPGPDGRLALDGLTVRAFTGQELDAASSAPADAAKSTSEERARAGKQRLAREAHPAAPALATLVVALRSGSVPGRYEVALDLRGADGILALDLVLDYDTAAFDVVGLRAPEGAAAFHVASRLDEAAGRLRLGLYSPIAAAGDPGLLVVEIETDGPAPRRMPFELDARANEGQIPLLVEVARPARPGRR